MTWNWPLNGEGIVNKEVFVKPVDEILQYNFKQVAILSIAYAVTFGAELAVIFMLPLFFKDTFLVPMFLAGVFGACFAVIDVLSCPSGGFISDKYGRKTLLVLLLAGASLGFFAMSQISADWPIVSAHKSTYLPYWFFSASFFRVALIFHGSNASIFSIVSA